MLLQVVHALAEPPDVLKQHMNLFLDDARVLAHAHVLEHGADGVEVAHKVVGETMKTRVR